MVMGRPTLFTEELALTICNRIEDGESLRKICSDDVMPNRSSVNKWLSENKNFSDQYARACVVRRENKFDEMYTVAEDTEDVPRARLLVDVLKWQLSKEEPKKYGDRLDLTGETTVTHKYEDMTDEQLEAAITARKDRLLTAD